MSQNKSQNYFERKAEIRVSLIVSLFALSLLGSHGAWASDDDEVFQSSGRSAAAAAELEKSKRRAYVGARDEQRLEVQASLPQPTRNADGSSIILDAADEPVTTTASD